MNKKDKFIQKAIVVHGDKYGYSLIEYKNCKEKVTIVCSKHGNFLQTPDSHISGKGCSKCGQEASKNSKKDDNKSFIKKANNIHNNKYNYDKVKYLSSKSKITITCPEHGDFKQTPHGHLNNGCPKCTQNNINSKKFKIAKDILEKASIKYKDMYDFSKANFINNTTKLSIFCSIHGEFNKYLRDIYKNTQCPYCYRESVNIDKRITKESFINKSNFIHNYKYNYEKAVYENCRKKVIITCPVHGDFEQRASSHMHGRGCKKCAREYNSFKKTDYIKSSKGRDTTLYLIRCWNESETFYKIGKTFKKINERFSSKKLMPYNYEIIHTIISKAEDIWDLEINFHNKYKNYKYKPSIKFGGVYECYEIELPINEIVSYE